MWLILAESDILSDHADAVITLPDVYRAYQDAMAKEEL